MRRSSSAPGWRSTARIFSWPRRLRSAPTPEAREEIQRSLERLKVDHVDLIQFHALAHPDEWDTVMGPGGALEAAVEAREKGLGAVHRGHRPRVDDRGHAQTEPQALRLRFGPDAVQLRHARERDGTGANSRKSFESAGNAGPPSRRSSPSPGAPGGSRRRTGTPGISRWKSKRISTRRCTGCWAAGTCF